MDRTGTRVTVVPQKEKKNYDFQANILELCLDCLDRGVVPSPEVPKRKSKFILGWAMFQYPIDEALDRKRKHSSDKVNNTSNFFKCMQEFQKELVKNYASRMKRS